MANNAKKTQDTVERIRAKVKVNSNKDTSPLSYNATADKATLDIDETLSKSEYLLKDLRSSEVSLVDKTEAMEDPIGVIDYSYFGQYLKFSDKLNLKVPSDKQNILKNPQDCLEILKALDQLGRLILGLEFDVEKEEYIGDRVQWYKSSENDISRERLLIEIKYKTLYLITKTARLINAFLIKPQFTLEEFKKLTNNTLLKDRLTLVTDIKLTDLKDILEGISRIFPEIIFPQLTEILVDYTPIKCLHNLQKMIGGSQMTASVKALSHESIWSKNSLGKASYTYRHSKNPSNNITFYINNSDNPIEIKFLAFDDAKEILNNFGVHPALFNLILGVIFFNKLNPDKPSKFKKEDLFKIFGLDKRSDLNEHKKIERVLKIINAVKSLVITAKWSTRIKIKGRYKTVSDTIQPCLMWNIAVKTREDPLTGNFLDLDVIASLGNWAKFFFNKEGKELGNALHLYATFCMKILELDPYRENLAFRIALLQLTMPYRDYRSVEFWLQENLDNYQEKVSIAKNDFRRAKEILDLWDRTILALERIGFTIHYDNLTYPETLRPNSTRKPRNCLDRTLQALVKFTPETNTKPISDIELKNNVLEETKPIKIYTGKELKEARLNCKPNGKNIKISQGMLANFVIPLKGENTMTQYKLSRIEKQDLVDPELAKSILKAIHYIKNNYSEALKAFTAT